MGDATLTRRDAAMLQWVDAGAKLLSTCAKRQYMAIVLSPEGRVVGAGYNGSPPGLPHCTDGFCPRLHEGSTSGSAYSNCIAVHAEANALMYSDRSDRRDGTLIVNGQPCWDCGKLIAGSGVKRAVIVNDPDYLDASRVNELIESAGVAVIGAERAPSPLSPTEDAPDPGWYSDPGYHLGGGGRR